ncbi:MAG: 4-hydroxyphenylpyruvate dioxygenase [Polyangiaceae bacterium]
MNTLGMRGLSFVEFTGPYPEDLATLFASLGFSNLTRHASTDLRAFTQGQARFLVQAQKGTFARRFAELHGPSVSALGFAFDDPRAAYAEALARGARPFHPAPGAAPSVDAPAVYGIGDSLVYFVDAHGRLGREFVSLEAPRVAAQLGFVAIDHLTNNVPQGALAETARFYRDIFDFDEIRAFDIDGQKTGLYSFALRSPCGTFSIPINEDKGATGQIAEYLREYRGAGVQHVALATRDILGTLDALRGRVPTLDIDASYYDDVFARVPGVREDHGRIRNHQVLVDGDARGYLLQVFTKNVIGPIFFELIQRENHASFGEGNFGALFRSLEKDQERRGVL